MKCSWNRNLAPFFLGGMLLVTTVQIVVTWSVVHQMCIDWDKEVLGRAKIAYESYLGQIYQELEGVHRGYAWWEDFNRAAFRLPAGEKLGGELRDSWEVGNVNRNALSLVVKPGGTVALGGTDAEFWYEALGDEVWEALKGRLEREVEFERLFFLRGGRKLLAVLGHSGDDFGRPILEGYHLYALEMTPERTALVGSFVGGTYAPASKGLKLRDSLGASEVTLGFTPSTNFSDFLLPFVVTTLSIQVGTSLLALVALLVLLRGREKLLATSKGKQELLENRNLQILELNFDLPEEKQVVEVLEDSTVKVESLLLKLKLSAENTLVNTAMSTGKVDDTNAVLDETQKKIYAITEHIHTTIGNVHNSAEHARKMLGEVQNLKEKAEDFSNLAIDLNQNALEGAIAVRDNGKRIAAVGQASERVLEILQVIGDISQRTHLLAINAAIEASRAGTHGKGFGVVAAEIRTLSDNVASNTREIESVVKDITDKIFEATTSTQSVGTLFDSIADQSDKNLELVDKIQEIIRGQTDFSQELVMENNLMEGIIQELENAIKEHIFGVGMISDSMRTLRELMDHIVASMADFGRDYAQLGGIIQTIRPIPKQLLERLETMISILQGQ